jgi:tyrosyl-tRNA synthetase
MSTSWGNVITLLDTPQDMFGKLMACADKQLVEYLWILPRCARPFTQEELSTRLMEGGNPRDLKLELAVHFVALYHGWTLAGENRLAGLGVQRKQME